MEGLGSFLSTKIKENKKKQEDPIIRRAAATMLGVPEDQIPLGMFKQENLAELQKEKFKAGLDPMKALINKAITEGSMPQGTQPAGTATTTSNLGLDSGKMMRGAIAKATGIPYEQMMTPEEKQQANIELATKESIKGEAMADRERLKKMKQANVDFEVARNKLRTTAAAFKAMSEASGGAGRIRGIIGGKIGGALGLNPYTQAYEGQLVEAAASLAKLASPSARVGTDIIAQFKKTLPSVVSTQKEFINQIRFSLHNAFGTALGNAGESYTPDVRKKVDMMVDDLINTPAMTNEDLDKVKQGLSIDESKYNSQFQTFNIGGKTYNIPIDKVEEFKKDMGL